METYWVLGVNNPGTFGRRDFIDFIDIYSIEKEFNRMIERFIKERKGP